MNQIESHSYLENQYVEMWVENGVIHEIFKPRTELELPDLQMLVRDRLKVSAGRMMPAYVDMRQLVYIDLAAIDYSATKESVAYLSAVAFHLDNIMTQFFFNTFRKFYTPLLPIKSFNSKAPALEWLEHFKRVN